MTNFEEFEAVWGNDEEVIAKFHTERWYFGGAYDAFEQCVDKNEWYYTEPERQYWLHVREVIIAAFGEQYPQEKEYPYRDHEDYDGRYEPKETS